MAKINLNLAILATSLVTQGRDEAPLPLEILSDAVGINAHYLGLAKIDQQPVVPRRPNVSRVFERVLPAVVESDGKGSERSPFDQVFDFRDFHGWKYCLPPGSASAG
jgi:hypothetical protein